MWLRIREERRWMPRTCLGPFAPFPIHFLTNCFNLMRMQFFDEIKFERDLAGACMRFDSRCHEIDIAIDRAPGARRSRLSDQRCGFKISLFACVVLVAIQTWKTNKRDASSESAIARRELIENEGENGVRAE